jgi:hypothetical protein
MECKRTLSQVHGSLHSLPSQRRLIMNRFERKSRVNLGRKLFADQARRKGEGICDYNLTLTFCRLRKLFLALGFSVSLSLKFKLPTVSLSGTSQDETRAIVGNQ